ncbi:DUF2946 domain-containing protein [Oxalicibacterium faecigallinarum]|nr:DUF2946 domain-containing protein [Oxalicibacterium faecigallinarum]
MTLVMQRSAAWIALCTILLAALAPSISHALAKHNAHGIEQTVVEICTMEGSKMVQVDAAQQPEPTHHQEQVDHFEHCPFCKTNSVATGLPATTAPLIHSIPPRGAFPALFYQAPQGLYVWTTASPRAPPALS